MYDLKEIKSSLHSNSLNALYILLCLHLGRVVDTLCDEATTYEGLLGDSAGTLADFLELGELMALDALERPESCGGHFREESQTEENEALRDDENFAHSAVWEFSGETKDPIRNKEELTFEYVPLTQRSYK